MAWNGTGVIFSPRLPTQMTMAMNQTSKVGAPPLGLNWSGGSLEPLLQLAPTPLHYRWWSLFAVFLEPLVWWAPPFLPCCGCSAPSAVLPMDVVPALALALEDRLACIECLRNSVDTGTLAAPPRTRDAVLPVGSFPVE